MPSERSAASDSDTGSSWKERYTALKARLASARAALEETRQALQASQERERSVRGTLTKVRERLHWHERALLRPEVLADLLPARARSRRDAAPDATAAGREASHAACSEAYAAMCGADPPVDAERVNVSGVTWWVPRDDRIAGQIADRVVAGRLPFVDILRTREVVANGTMIDIGANIGLTSVTRALLGDVDLVYAAEPAPANFACLVRSVIDNGLRGIVLADRVAISDRDGMATLRLSGSIGGHSLRSDVEGIDVPTMRLDTWVGRLGIDASAVCFVKVDTQGHEAHVLDGAPHLLERPGVVWELEFSPPHLERAGRDPGALIARMQSVFTNFIDLNPYAPGDRLRPIAELPEALAYLGRDFTDLLVYKRLA